MLWGLASLVQHSLGQRPGAVLLQQGPLISLEIHFKFPFSRADPSFLLLAGI
jgi:hypothetical protein